MCYFYEVKKIYLHSNIFKHKQLNFQLFNMEMVHIERDKKRASEREKYIFLLSSICMCIQHTYHGLKIADFINSFLHWKNCQDDKTSCYLNRTGVAYSTERERDDCFCNVTILLLLEARAVSDSQLFMFILDSTTHTLMSTCSSTSTHSSTEISVQPTHVCQQVSHYTYL